MKKNLIKYYVYFISFFSFLVISCDKNYMYGFKSLDETDLENFNLSIIEVCNNPEIINEFPNKKFNPNEYDIGKVFKDYNEIEKYFINLYGYKSKYKNEEQFNLAKETGIFIVTSLDHVIRTFVFTDNGIVLKNYYGDLDFSYVFSNYDRQDYIKIKKEFPGIFEKGNVYKYYYHGSNVYKYTFYNGGHLLIGLKQIEFVK